MSSFASYKTWPKFSFEAYAQKTLSNYSKLYILK